MTKPIKARGYPSSTRYGERYTLSVKRKPAIIDEKIAYAKNPVPRNSRISVKIFFVSYFSILECTENKLIATSSHKRSKTSIT